MSLGEYPVTPTPATEKLQRYQSFELCKLCRLFFISQTTLPTGRTIPQQIFQTSEGYYYHRTLHELEVASKHGCKLCNDVFHHHPLRNNWKIQSPDRKITFRISYERNENHLKVEGWRASDLWLGAYWRRERVDLLCRWYLFTWPDNVAAELISGRISGVEIACSKSYDTVKNWLHGCIDNHEDCNMPNIVELPKRLVEVSSLGEAEWARLARTEGMTGNYYALSYCWGKPGQPFSTTSDTIEEYSKNLPIDNLPETILDALEVTRKLGLRYIWIDSLCIIQNNPADLATELGNMSKIYQNAQLTISAASAEDCTKGFLQRRLRYEDNESTRYYSSTLMNNGATGDFLLSEQSSWDKEYLPINSRAWTLQETLLAQRLLIYSHETVVWKCQTPSANNTDWYSAAGFMNYTTSDIIGTRIAESDRGPPVPYQGPVPYDDQDMVKRMMWGKTLEHYSYRKLSNKNDRLPAISAAAEFFSEYLGPEPGDYLAGLWRNTLVYDLLWGNDKESGIRDHLNVPSWSWASISGGITDRYVPLTAQGDFQQIVEILSCEVRLQNKLVPFGEVQGGELVIFGNLSEVLIGPSEPRSKLTGKSQFFHKDTRKYLEGSEMKWDTINDYENAMAPNNTSSLGNAHLVQAWALVLGRTLWEDDCDCSWYKTARGLVLRSASSGGGEFVRVGTFESRSGASESCWWEELERTTVHIV